MVSLVEPISKLENHPVVDNAIDELASKGYAIVPNFINPENADYLYRYALGLKDADWQQAGVGRADNYTTNTQVRRDRIRWLQAQDSVERAYLDTMATLQQQLNRQLFMGLFDYESHLAHYPPGAFYRKHLDAFKGRSNRILTTVVYLNPDWQVHDGGELVMYDDHHQVLKTVLPKAGTLVLFLSDTFVHEVREGHRDRYSITGWFRHNTSINGVIDPTR